MTFSDILSLEAQNTCQITFYYEGTFWKAYERSAFLVCEHYEKFLPSKKSVKYLHGAEIVSIGIPAVTMDRLFSTSEKVVDEEKRKVFKTVYAVNEEAFMAWKERIGVKERKDSSAAPGSEENAVVERLRKYDLATATPMDCMLLVMELKKMIAHGHIHNP